MMRKAPQRRLALAAWVAAFLLSFPAFAQTAPELLKRAKDAFEYGDFSRTVELLKGLPDSGLLSENDRVEAWRLLGLSYFYLHRVPEADNALFGLLKQNPDYQLDPFYVPPDAVAFFDDVKKRNEQYLAPIRERRNARLKAQAEEEALREEADRRRREELSRPTQPIVIERQIAQNSQLVAFMPFGLGQFQNDNRKLGMGLLVAESATAAVSVAAYWLIEALRGDNLKFPSNVYTLAQRANTVKIWSAATFYLLWVAGAVEANVNFVPTRLVGESAQTPPSAAPAGPLAPPQKPEKQPELVPPTGAPTPREPPPPVVVPPAPAPQGSPPANTEAPVPAPEKARAANETTPAEGGGTDAGSP